MSSFIDLPAECLLLIGDQVEKLKDLNALARAKPQLHALLNRQLYRRSQDSWGETHVLMWAARAASVGTVQYCLDMGMDINSRETSKELHTPLLIALDSYRDILSHGEDWRGKKLLESDIRGTLDKYLAVRDFKINNGANVNCKSGSSFEWTPLQISNLLPNDEMARFLLARGASPTIPDSTGRSALHMAVHYESLWQIRLLVQNGVDINLPDNDVGHAPLHLAVYRSGEDEISTLLELGADVNAENFYGETPLHSAVSTRAGYAGVSERLVQLLIDAGANLEAMDYDGRTPLVMAVINKRPPRLVRCLIKNKAKIDAMDENGNAAWELARGTPLVKCFPRRSDRIAGISA